MYLAPYQWTKMIIKNASVMIQTIGIFHNNFIKDSESNASLKINIVSVVESLFCFKNEK